MPSPNPCLPNTCVPVLTNVPGPQGFQGATGPQGPVGQTGATGAPGAGLVWLGLYNLLTTYVQNNAVQSGGSAWVALQTVTGVTPVAGVYWSLLAAAGGT